MKTKPKWRVDENNLLSLNTGKEALAIDGTFSVDEQNRLVYWINAPPAWRRKYNLPDEITFTGNWRLNSDYDLELQVQESKTQPAVERNILTIKGEIISCESDRLVFEIRSSRPGEGRIRLLKLAGFWKANEYNQLVFVVEKKSDPDTLVFKGTWEINENQQIVYSLESRGLKKGASVSQEIMFSGFWEISSRERLAYIFSSGTASRFEFRVQLETPNVYPKSGEIKYRLGIGFREGRPEKEKVISLYGTWKFSRSAGIAFEMDYGQGRIQTLEFGAEVNFSKSDKMVFSLIGGDQEKLGLNVVFTHKFLRKLDAEFFARLKQYRKYAGIDIGVRIPF